MRVRGVFEIIGLNEKEEDNREMLEVGLRVVRGSDWKWGDQDGGEGHAGTVVEIGKPSNSNNSNNAGAAAAAAPSSGPIHADKTPNKTVIVQWDHGSRSNYRIGYQDAYDLRVFDNAAAGVKHVNIICDACKVHGIFIVGIRWKCSQCFDYDLCTKCYMADAHDITHAFQRFITTNAVGIQLSTRENLTKIPLKGIFIGAKVIRGPDWEWGNQDGGKTGRVIDIRGWDNESSRSVATVTWPSGSTNVYRLGYKGCVDLRYVEEASAGTYYKEHLPLLGQPTTLVPVEVAPPPPVLASPPPARDNITPNISENSDPPSPSHRPAFTVGDTVKVLMNVDTLKSMQAGHGGWNPRMADYIGKVGTVHRITDKGDIRVQYEGCNNRWTFHPGALTKVENKNPFSVGDIVRIKRDINVVKFFQRGHGEWVDVMKVALGKSGKVIKIYSDGDMRVQLEGHTWTFNPLSVILSPEETAKARAEANRALPVERNKDAEVEKLLRDAARGDAGIATVKEFLRKYPGRVDARGGPGGGRKTCLMVAAHQGQRELCLLVLEAGASLTVADEDGDTPLHYAAFGNQPEIIDLLLSRGAPINAVNNGNCSALHVAVNKQHVDCVRVLLRHNCDVNLQDSYGDTTLHDAINKEVVEIVDALCACERVDYTLLNKRGFNVLHHAALKGNSYASQRLVERARQLVDEKKDDGFSALHLAALNGHRDVAAALVLDGGARVDLKNNRGQTSLFLAASQGHWGIVELLVANGADVGVTDEEGDTALHVAIIKYRTPPLSMSDKIPSPACDADNVLNVHRELYSRKAPTDLALTCFLVSVDSGGAVFETVKNSKDKTPLDLLRERYPSYIEVVKSFRDQRLHQPLRPVRRLRPLPPLTIISPSSSSTTSASSTSIGGTTVAETHQPPIHQIDTAPAPQSDEESSRKPPVRNTAIDCENCQRNANSPPGEEVNQLSGPAGSVGGGGGGGCTNCSQCGCALNKSQTYGDAHLNREELEKEIEREKIKNGYADKNKSDREKDKDLERLRYLETRIADLEEANMCSICMERRRNVAFLCGHGACEHCAAPLKTCHMCRQTITKKINLY